MNDVKYCTFIECELKVLCKNLCSKHYAQQRRKNDPTIAIRANKRYYETHKIEESARCAKYRKDNKKELSNYFADHYRKNKTHVLKIKKQYKKNRSINDKKFMLLSRLRSRLSIFLKNVGKKKKYKFTEYIGCTPIELKQYLESKFQPGMTWDNYGKTKESWSIDHVVPMSSIDFNNDQSFLDICHYTNLQPLWHIDNIKKSNK